MSPIKFIVQALGFVLLLALLAPLLFSVWVSFSPDSFLTPPGTVWSLRWYQEFWIDPRWKAALFRSLLVSLGATTFALAVGIPLSFGLKRYSILGARLIEWICLLPALVPPVALGMGLLFWVQGTIWQNHILIPAHAMLGLPIVLLIVGSGFQSIDPTLEAAARGLGATHTMVAWRITLPLLLPSILVAAAGVFVISLNESMLAIFLTHPGNETLPAVAWPQLRHAPTPLVAVASCASVGVTVLFLGLCGWIWTWGQTPSIKSRIT